MSLEHLLKRIDHLNRTPILGEEDIGWITQQTRSEIVPDLTARFLVTTKGETKIPGAMGAIMNCRYVDFMSDPKVRRDVALFFKDRFYDPSHTLAVWNEREAEIWNRRRRLLRMSPFHDFDGRPANEDDALYLLLIPDEPQEKA